MTNISKTLLFFGNERLVSGLKSTDAPVLRGLIKRGYTIKAVVSHHHEGQSRNNRRLEVAEIAEANGIPILLPNKPTDAIEEITNFNADAAILVAYGRIIPQSIIDLFPLGIINIHPSLLPKHRGPTPIESAVTEGDTKTGVSIMQLTAGMDTGPVYKQAEIKLDGSETKFDLYDKVVNVSDDLLFSTLPEILDGSLQPTPQDDSQATYTQLLSKADGLLNPSLISAIEAERIVRAYLGFPKTKLNVLNQDIIVTKAHVSSEKKSPLDIVCRDGAFLSIDELIGPSGRTMSSESFLNGYTD